MFLHSGSILIWLNSLTFTSNKFWIHYVWFAGKDATDDFEDVGHSTTAKAMLDEYYVGDIDSATVPAKTTFIAPPAQAVATQDKSSDFVIKILQFLVPLLILGLALAVRSYTKAPSS